MRLHPLLGHEDFDFRSGQFIMLVPEQLFRRSIGHLDPAFAVDQQETIRSTIEQQADIALLDDEALDQSIQQNGDGHVDAIDEQIKCELQSLLPAQGKRANRRNECVPGDKRRKQRGRDAGPQAANQRSQDDGGIKGDEGNLGSGGFGDRLAHHDRNQHQNYCKDVGKERSVANREQLFNPRIDPEACIERHRDRPPPGGLR